jgi:hypothetical protein
MGRSMLRPYMKGVASAVKLRLIEKAKDACGRFSPFVF